jgi:hypothetical protein
MKTKTSLMGNSFNEPAVAIQQNETETSYRSTSDIIRISLIAGITECLTVAPATKAHRPLALRLTQLTLPLTQKHISQCVICRKGI